jgi:hypothetical protein
VIERERQGGQTEKAPEKRAGLEGTNTERQEVQRTDMGRTFGEGGEEE